MSTNPPKENPYQLYGKHWWYDDENQETHGPYLTQVDALRAILDRMAPRKPSIWRKIGYFFAGSPGAI